MREAVQDLFDTIKDPFTATCITTNGVIFETRDGVTKNVMGAGVAGLVRNRYPGCDEVLGLLILANGNKVQQFLSKPVVLIAFPTKNNWKKDSTLQLIEQSAHQLKEWADNHPQFTTIVLPRPGCHYGGLSWEQVKPILEPILTQDKFLIIHKE